MSKEQKNILHTYKRVLLDANVCIDLVTHRNIKFNSREFIKIQTVGLVEKPHGKYPVFLFTAYK